MPGKSYFRVIVVLAGVVILAAMFFLVGCPGPADQQVDEPVQRSVEKPKVSVADSPTDDQPAEEAPASKDESIPAAGKIVAVSQDDFEDEVIQADTPVVVDCWADWCAPCHMIRPTLEQLAKEFAGKLKFVSVDVEANPKLAEQFQVAYLPTVLIIDNGKEIDRAIGVLPPKELRNKIVKALSSE